MLRLMLDVRSFAWKLGSRLLIAAVSVLLVVAAVGKWRFDARRDRVHAVSGALPAVLTDASTLARGEHLAHTLGGCAECHGTDLGGQVMEENALMRLVAPNLTPAGGLREFSDADWFRAIAHGVDRQGRSLMVMPARELSAFSDRDLAAIVAYCKSVPPVVRDVGVSSVSWLGSFVFGLTGAEIFSAEGFEHERRAKTAPAAGATREYGSYLVQSCRGCHGPELRGGITVHPGAPPSSDISPSAMERWTFGEFERALRAGRRRDGSELDPAMPWTATKGLSHDELRALYLALCQK